MSALSTAFKIFKKILIAFILTFLFIGLLAFIFLGDSEKEKATSSISSSNNLKSTPKVVEQKLSLDTQDVLEKGKAAGAKQRAALIQSIGDAKLVIKDASLCLVVGEWALYKADDSKLGLTKANLEIADALAKKGQSWINTFVSNVGENSYLHKAYLKSKMENIKKCENNSGFHSCWKQCLKAFDNNKVIAPEKNEEASNSARENTTSLRVKNYRLEQRCSSYGSALKSCGRGAGSRDCMKSQMGAAQYSVASALCTNSGKPLYDAEGKRWTK